MSASATAREVAHLNSYAATTAARQRYRPLTRRDFMPAVQQGMAGFGVRIPDDINQDYIGTGVQDVQFGDDGSDDGSSTSSSSLLTDVAGAFATIAPGVTNILSATGIASTSTVKNSQYNATYKPGMPVPTSNTGMLLLLGAVAVGAVLLLKK